jgi:hypothetical protein
LLFISFSPCRLRAQVSVDTIKASTDYFWGEGVGKTAALADKLALDMLISNISVDVESSLSIGQKQQTKGKKTEFSENVHSIVETHSAATLKNTEMLSWGEEPEVHVFRYVKRADVNKIFSERERKVREFVAEALKAEKNVRIADALKYGYWALMLLHSLPEAGNVTLDVDGSERHLDVFLPQKINEILKGLRFSVADTRNDGDLTQHTVDITCNGRPVANCEYSFYDGRNWSLTVAAKDGRGVVETAPGSSDKLRIKIEYAFENEWKTDREVENALQKVEPVVFKASYIDFSIAEKQAEKKEIKKEEKKKPDTAIEAAKNAVTDVVADPTPTLTLLDSVEHAIRTRNYDFARPCFTDEGYDIYNRLIAYGRATVAGAPVYRSAPFEDGIMVRSLPLKFAFSGNRRIFVENIVFNIDTLSGRIRSLSFALNDAVCQDIMRMEQWNEYSRLALISFLENYQTAYALKRLDYIESIFSDDALIIVGKILRKQPLKDGSRFDLPEVRLNKYSKEQYIRQLATVFKSQEYVNLKFSDVSVKKAGRGGEIYGIQVAQDYFSTTYGDHGYLFLAVDLNDSSRPVIHIRTWQPEKDPDFGLYDIGNF